MLDVGHLEPRVELRHETPVEDGEAPRVRLHDEVARVGIRVQQPRLEHHRQVRVHGHAAERRDALPRRVVVGAHVRVQALAVDPPRREHAARRRRFHGLRREDRVRQWSLRNGVDEVARVFGLAPVVELIHKPHAPGVDDAHQIRVEVREFPQGRADDPQEVQVERDGLRDVGPLHLDGDAHAFVAVVHVAAVDLAQRRGRDGRRRQVLEDVRRARDAQLRGDERARLGVVEGRAGVLERR